MARHLLFFGHTLLKSAREKYELQTRTFTRAAVFFDSVLAFLQCAAHDHFRSHNFDIRNWPALEGKQIGIEKLSISGMFIASDGDGRLRGQVRIHPGAGAALAMLKSGGLDAVVARRSEIEAVMRDDPAFTREDVTSQRMPCAGWTVRIAVREDSVELARHPQATPCEMVVSGELASLVARHGVWGGKP